MRWAASRASRMPAIRLVSIMARISAGLVSASGLRLRAPTLLTRMSSRPCSASMRAKACSMACSSDTSNGCALARRPCWRRSDTAASTACASRPLISTCAPLPASACAMRSPRPRAEPVTKATWPDRAKRCRYGREIMSTDVQSRNSGAQCNSLRSSHVTQYTRTIPTTESSVTAANMSVAFSVASAVIIR
ncbi:Uncharacterised protein [Bordetella pertussis]|nr:Uncharacterised protein [Bordetella pertussis]